MVDTTHCSVGVLAFQGCVTPHLEHLEKLGVNARRVTTERQLTSIDGLIIPGGESTAMIRLMKRRHMWDPVMKFCRSKPSWGICAGAILMSSEVENPTQDCFGAISIKTVRNAYGCQLDSFSTKTKIEADSRQFEMSVDFIRAPKFTILSDECVTLATHENSPILIRQRNALVSAFHTELGEDSSLHEFFMSMVVVPNLEFAKSA